MPNLTGLLAGFAGIPAGYMEAQQQQQNLQYRQVLQQMAQAQLKDRLSQIAAEGAAGAYLPYFQAGGVPTSGIPGNQAPDGGAGGPAPPAPGGQGPQQPPPGTTLDAGGALPFAQPPRSGVAAMPSAPATQRPLGAPGAPSTVPPSAAPPPAAGAAAPAAGSAAAGGQDGADWQAMARQLTQQMDPGSIARGLKQRNPNLSDAEVYNATRLIMGLSQSSNALERTYMMALLRQQLQGAGFQHQEQMQQERFGQQEKLQTQREQAIQTRADARSQLQRDLAGGRTDQAKVGAAIRTLNAQLAEVRASLYGYNALPQTVTDASGNVGPNPDYQAAKQEEREIITQLRQLGYGQGVTPPAPAAPRMPVVPPGGAGAPLPPPTQ